MNRPSPGHDAASDLLVSLAVRAEKGEARESVRTVTARSTDLEAYRNDPDPDFRSGFHAFLEVAARAGAVSLVWRKHLAQHELQTVKVVDITRLREHLGLSPIDATASRAFDRVVRAVSRDGPAHPSALEMAVQLREGWREHRSPQGLAPTDDQAIDVVFRTIAALLAGAHAGLDMRTFSASLHGNSKVIEQRRKLIERIWGSHFDIVEFKLDSYLGLEKTPQPFFIGGRVELAEQGQTLSLSQGYRAFPPSAVPDLGFVTPPIALVIVENWTSAVQAAETAPEKVGILYSGGFPSPRWIAALRELLRHLPADAGLFHWGDLDHGGFRIFQHIARALGESGLRLKPFRMSPGQYGSLQRHARKPSPSETRSLQKIMIETPATADVIDEVLTSNQFGLEQELLPRDLPWRLV
ncbi:Wadjet anti-phage system protein JetD domain-containing protein [Panacagrimonas sp.]|uniref:Wadjet anti-phage system protein JetD domain-containing protein n=1 Tax=Panacagrimonas sp. TaxID=2480088 RepID=UPI003B527777